MGDAPFNIDPAMVLAANLGPDAAQDPRLQALMAMIAQNQGAQPSGLPGGAPAPTQPPPPRFTMSAAGPAPDVPTPANPAPSFLQRLAGSFFGIPGDASPDVRRAAISKGLMSTGLQMMHDSYGVPGQAAPSFGKSLTHGLIVGQGVAKDYLDNVPDETARNILSSINWQDTSSTGLQGATIALLRAGRTKDAQALIDLIKTGMPKDEPSFTALDANGRTIRMTRDASGHAVPMTTPDGKPVYEHETPPSQAAPAHMTTEDGHIQQWDPATRSWKDTGMKAPPRVMDMFTSRVQGVAATIDGYMRDLEKYPSNPSALEGFVNEFVSSHPEFAALRGAAGASAQIQNELLTAFGQADMLRGGRGGNPLMWREAGRRFVPQAGDAPETRATKLQSARELVRWIRQRSNQNGAAAGLALQAGMAGGMGEGNSSGGEPPPEP